MKIKLLVFLYCTRSVVVRIDYSRILTNQLNNYFNLNEKNEISVKVGEIVDFGPMLNSNTQLFQGKGIEIDTNSTDYTRITNTKLKIKQKNRITLQIHINSTPLPITIHVTNSIPTSTLPATLNYNKHDTLILNLLDYITDIDTTDTLTFTLEPTHSTTLADFIILNSTFITSTDLLYSTTITITVGDNTDTLTTTTTLIIDNTPPPTLLKSLPIIQVYYSEPYNYQLSYSNYFYSTLPLTLTLHSFQPTNAVDYIDFINNAFVIKVPIQYTHSTLTLYVRVTDTTHSYIDTPLTISVTHTPTLSTLSIGLIVCFTFLLASLCTAIIVHRYKQYKSHSTTTLKIKSDSSSPILKTFSVYSHSPLPPILYTNHYFYSTLQSPCTDTDYTLSTLDSTPLPNWLSFDSTQCSIYGTPTHPTTLVLLLLTKDTHSKLVLSHSTLLLTVENSTADNTTN